MLKESRGGDAGLLRVTKMGVGGLLSVCPFSVFLQPRNLSLVKRERPLLRSRLVMADDDVDGGVKAAQTFLSYVFFFVCLVLFVCF